MESRISQAESNGKKFLVLNQSKLHYNTESTIVFIENTSGSKLKRWVVSCTVYAARRKQWRPPHHYRASFPESFQNYLYVYFKWKCLLVTDFKTRSKGGKIINSWGGRER